MTVTPPPYRLRRAGMSDAAVLSALKIACWRDSYAGHLPTELLAGLENNPFHSVAAWRSVLETDGPERVTELVDIADEPVGFVRFGPYDGDLGRWRGVIDAVYLLGLYRGRGLGSSLVAHARARLTAAELVPVVITTFAFNTRASVLYERLGAVRIARVVAFEHAGRDVEEIVLGWPDGRPGV